MNFILIIVEFFYFKRSKMFFYFSLILFLFSVINFYSSELKMEEIKNLTSNSITLLGILLGFVSAVFTVVITISNEEVNNAKLTEIKGLFNKRKTYLYDELVSSFLFLIILLGFLLVSNFIFPIIINNLRSTYVWFFSFCSSLIIFAILRLISTILDFYFIISSSKNRPLK